MQDNQDTESYAKKKRKLEPEDNSNRENLIKKQCLYIEVAHPYLYSSHGMVSFTPEYIQHLKQSYIERSYHGAPNYTCKYCDAMFWYDERNKTDSTKKKQILYSKALFGMKDFHRKFEGTDSRGKESRCSVWIEGMLSYVPQERE